MDFFDFWWFFKSSRFFVSSCIIRLFQSSTCFEQTRDHHQEVNSINTASGTVTLKKSEWSKINKIQFSCIACKTLTSTWQYISNHTNIRYKINFSHLEGFYQDFIIPGQCFIKKMQLNCILVILDHSLFFQSDYTRCCINTIDLLMMSICFLVTCRGVK